MAVFSFISAFIIVDTFCWLTSHNGEVNDRFPGRDAEVVAEVVAGVVEGWL